MELLGILILLFIVIGLAAMIWRTRRVRGRYLRPDARHHSGSAAPAEDLSGRAAAGTAPTERPDVHPGLSPAQELQGAPDRMGPERDESLVESEEVERERATARRPEDADREKRTGRRA